MKKSAMCLAAALCAAVSLADTIAWYHFDELPDTVGEGVSAGTTFENSANPGTLQGVADSASTTALTAKDGYVLSGDVWTSGILVRDPVQDTVSANGKSVKFAEGDAEGDYDVGVVRIPDTGSALPCNSFTVEFFVRLDSSGKERVLVSRGECSTGNYWYLEVTPDNKLQLFVSYGGTLKGAGASGGNVAINDGKWHHVALVRDGVYWAVYLDYSVARILNPSAVSGFVDPGETFLSGSEIVVGRLIGSPTSGISDCPIDELRISNEWLDTGDMLSFVEGAYAAVDGVSSHLRFDTADAYPLSSYTLFDWARYRSDKAAITTADGGSVVWQSANAAETINHSFRVAGGADRGSLAFTGNSSTSKSGYLEVLDVGSALGGDFTVEMFFKTTGGKFGGGGGIDSGYLLNAAGQWHLRILSNNNFDNGLMQAFYHNFGGNFYCGSTRFDDGEWHHLACTYDSAEKIFRVFVDYVLQNFAQGVTLSAPSTGKLRVGGFANNSDDLNYTFNDLAIDEVRVTADALSPWQFLTSENVPGPTLFWAGFDRSLAVLPETALTTDGTTSGTTAYASGLCEGITSKDGTVLRASNIASLSLSDGATATFDAPFVCVATNTVELFVKLASASAGGSVMSLLGGTDSSAVWSLCLGSDAESLVLVPGSESGVATGCKLKQGKWDCVTLVFATPVSGNTIVKLATSSGDESEVDLGQRLAFSAFDPKIVVGGTSMSVVVDELRISEGELPDSDRLRFVRPGFVILCR